MSWRLFISAEAEDDVVALAAYLSNESEAVAARFLAKAKETFQSLTEFPFLGSLWESSLSELQNLRFKPVAGFPNHLVFYTSEESLVRIVRVLHAARDLENLL